jgi:Fe-S-cluster containining protein
MPLDCQSCGACCSLSCGRCPELRGAVGIATSCAIYATRPAICRLFEPGSVECKQARVNAGLDDAD